MREEIIQIYDDSILKHFVNKKKKKKASDMLRNNS